MSTLITTSPHFPVSAPTERERSVPGSRLALWLSLGVALALAFPLAQAGILLVTYDLLVGALFLWDRARLKAVELSFARDLAPRFFAHQSLSFQLAAQLTRGPRLRLWLEQTAPPSFTISPSQHQGTLKRGQRLELEAELRSDRHGIARLTHVAVRRESALGLCAIVADHSCPNELRAYPRLPFGKSSWPALALTRPGNVPRPRHESGQGEIEALREYAPTDPMRSIDWKASAKRHRPITRAYQPERSQTLWLVLDASRGMLAQSEPGSSETRFETAMTSALALADAALSQGDQVGLMVYGRALALALKPRHGRAQLLLLIEQLLTVQPEPCELNAAGMLESFLELAPKRCLFVFFSDLHNEADLSELARYAPRLTRRHLALCVSLREAELVRHLRAPIESESDVYRKVAASHLQEERMRLQRKLQQAGLSVIEGDRAGLAHAALAEYQRLKRAGRL